MSYAQNAYAKTAITGTSQRELEAAALMKAAIRMKTVQDQWDTDRSDLDAVTPSR